MDMSNDILIASIIEHWNEVKSDYCLRLSQIGDHYTCNLVKNLCNTIAEFGFLDLCYLREYLWEQLHAFSWKDVESIYRELYASATVLLTGYYLCISSESVDDRHLARMCDMGLLLGSGSDCEVLHKLLSTINSNREHSAKRRKIQTSCRTVSLPPTISDSVTILEIASTPSLVTFLTSYLEPQRPVVLTNVMDDWSALTKWADLSYFNTVAGHRTVPIELGSSYLNSDFASKLITLEEFIDNHILECTDRVGYLAQHQLLKQIPDLQKDISIPDYCALLLDIDEQQNEASQSVEEEDVKVQMWLGPVGTLSPLHHDCYYNLLCQVVGYKYVRLYHPDQSVKLHPMSGVMSNNSCVDLTSSESIASYPSVREAVYSEYVLGPGEVLFIPRWHWHLVLALDETTALEWRRTHLKTEQQQSQQQQDECRAQFSASVSLWWGSRIEKTAD